MLLIRLWAATLRFKIDPEDLTRAKALKKPAIILFWHNHIFLAAVGKKAFKRPYKMSAIASTSRDGAWPAAVFHQLGVTIIRGSAHTRGVSAAREMLAVHKHGDQDLCLTPDGSRGPRYHLRPGAVFLATQAESPILLTGATFHRAWRFKSWDRFYLPKPFSRIDVRLRIIPFERLAAVPTEKEAREFLETELLAITVDPDEPLPAPQ
tara:strand:- start:26390 stop:27013 length:624 start_codon:yes stop_codon:yes gene_type:complete